MKIMWLHAGMFAVVIAKKCRLISSENVSYMIWRVFQILTRWYISQHEVYVISLTAISHLSSSEAFTFKELNTITSIPSIILFHGFMRLSVLEVHSLIFVCSDAVKCVFP